MPSSCVINPRKDPGEPDLPGSGIFAVNPSDTAHMLALGKDYGCKQHFLFHSKLCFSQQTFFAGPAVGAPMAVMCLEKLIALGARQVIIYGWCGAIHPDLHAQDIFVPTYALSEEGTSIHYPCPCMSNGQEGLEGFLVPDMRLQKKLVENLSTKGYPVQSGLIWTTDAVYRETRERVSRYANQGIMAVDMEYAALCAVAAFRGISLAAVMLVSDELYHESWRPQYKRKSFRKRSRQILTDLHAMLPALSA